MLQNTLRSLIWSTSAIIPGVNCSKAAISTVNSISPSFANFRQSLIDKGYLQLREDHYEFIEDFIFGSPSTSAAMVMGRNANGTLEWKLANGQTLKDIETTENT